MVGRLMADRLGASIGLLLPAPDLSADDAIAISVAPPPTIGANKNWGPRTDFSELIILSRSASGIVPPIVTASPSNSACDPGGLNLSSAALRSLVQLAGVACWSTTRSPVTLLAPNTVLSESVIAKRVVLSLTVPE